MSTVANFPGQKLPTSEPNPVLIKAMRELLGMAESGQLQSFIGTGFSPDGLRLASWFDFHNDVYQMLGALAWLQAEYIARHTTARSES